MLWSYYCYKAQLRFNIIQISLLQYWPLRFSLLPFSKKKKKKKIFSSSTNRSHDESQVPMQQQTHSSNHNNSCLNFQIRMIQGFSKDKQFSSTVFILLAYPNHRSTDKASSFQTMRSDKWTEAPIQLQSFQITVLLAGYSVW